MPPRTLPVRGSRARYVVYIPCDPSPIIETSSQVVLCFFHSSLVDQLLVDSAGQKTAVDDQSLSRNERSGIGAEIDGSSDEFFGSAEAAHRRPHQQLLAARPVVEQVCIQGCAEDTGRDCVYRNALL